MFELVPECEGLQRPAKDRSREHELLVSTFDGWSYKQCMHIYKLALALVWSGLR